MPDDPVAHGQAEAIESNLDLGRVLVADGDIEGAGRLQNPPNTGKPSIGKGEVVLTFSVVIVFVVLIANIEGRIGKGEVDARGRQFAQTRDTVPRNYLVAHHVARPIPGVNVTPILQDWSGSRRKLH